MALPEYGPLEQGRDLRKVVDAVIDAYARSGCRIGDSDLDDEQPHPTHIPLGIIRLAKRCALWRNAYKDVADAHEAREAAARERRLAKETRE